MNATGPGRCIWLAVAAVGSLFQASVSVRAEDFTLAGLRRAVDTALEKQLVAARPPEIRFQSDGVWVDWGFAETQAMLETRRVSVVVGPRDGEAVPTEERVVWVQPWRESPLRMMFLLRQIQRTRTAPEQRRTWSPYLARAERLVDRQLALIREYETNHPDPDTPSEDSDDLTALSRELHAYEGHIMRVLYSNLDSLAENRNLTVHTDEPRLEFKTPEDQGNHYHVRIATGLPLEITTKASGIAGYYLSEFRFYKLTDGKAGVVPDIAKWDPLQLEVDEATDETMLTTDRAAGKLRVMIVWPPDRRVTIEPLDLSAQEGGETRYYRLTADGKFVRQKGRLVPEPRQGSVDAPVSRN